MFPEGAEQKTVCSAVFKHLSEALKFEQPGSPYNLHQSAELVCPPPSPGYGGISLVPTFLILLFHSEWINLVVIAAEFWDNLRGAPLISESIQFQEKGNYYQDCSCLQLEALSATCDTGAWKPGSKRHLGSIWKDTSPEKESLAMVPFSLLLYAARHAEKRRKRWSSVFSKEWSHEVNVQGVLRRAVTRPLPHPQHHCAGSLEVPKNSPQVPGVLSPRLSPSVGTGRTCQGILQY